MKILGSQILHGSIFHFKEMKSIGVQHDGMHNEINEYK
jgi:hypothetical protein